MTVPISSLTDTWNSSGTAFTAIGMNVTDTGHAAASRLLDLQVGGSSKLSVQPNGDINGAVLSTDTANFNVAIGKGTGNIGIVSGQFNTSLGAQAGNALTTGGGNAFVGVNAGLVVTTGSNNTFVGAYNGTAAPGTSVTTGSNNTIIGPAAGSSTMSKNTIIATGDGVISLWSDNDVRGSLGVGSLAGNFATTTGQYNTCFGNASGYTLSSGSGNTLLGTWAGFNLTTGSNNTFIGATSAFGSSAGTSVTTGSNNTIIGAAVGSAAMANQVILADGASNIVVQYDQLNKTFATPTTTVGALPTAGTIGRRAFVTDANASTFFTVAAGSGSNKVPVFDDGTNWRIG